MAPVDTSQAVFGDVDNKALAIASIAGISLIAGTAGWGSRAVPSSPDLPA